MWRKALLARCIPVDKSCLFDYLKKEEVVYDAVLSLKDREKLLFIHIHCIVIFI